VQVARSSTQRKEPAEMAISESRRQYNARKREAVKASFAAKQVEVKPIEGMLGHAWLVEVNGVEVGQVIEFGTFSRGASKFSATGAARKFSSRSEAVAFLVKRT
jgi:hypothetical protein